MRDFYDLKDAIDELNEFEKYDYFQDNEAIDSPDDVEFELFYDELIMKVKENHETIHTIKLQLSINQSCLTFVSNEKSLIDEYEILEPFCNWAYEKKLDLIFLICNRNDKNELETEMFISGENMVRLVSIIQEEGIRITHQKDGDFFGWKTEFPLYKCDLALGFTTHGTNFINVYLNKNDKYFLIKNCRNEMEFKQFSREVKRIEEERENLLEKLFKHVKTIENTEVKLTKEGFDIENIECDFKKTYPISIEFDKKMESSYVINTRNANFESVNENEVYKKMTKEYDAIVNLARFENEVVKFIERETPEVKITRNIGNFGLSIDMGKRRQNIRITDKILENGSIQYELKITDDLSNKTFTENSLEKIISHCQKKIKDFYVRNRLTTLF
jgi:hypothetical protein